MRVASVCPACSRPAAGKGRSTCIYCGAALRAVETGKVGAAGSGDPIEVPEEHLKPVPAPLPSPPPAPQPRWMLVSPETGPVRRFFAKGWVRALLVVGFVLLAILALGRLIDDHRPPGYRSSAAPAKGR